MRIIPILFFLISFFLLTLPLLAQRKTDNRVVELFERGVDYIGDNQNDSLKIIIEKLENLPLEYVDNEVIAYKELMLGHYLKRSKVDTSILYGERSLSYFKNVKKYEEVAICYLIIGSALSNRGEMVAAFDKYEEGIEYLIKEAPSSDEIVKRKIARIKYNSGFTMIRYGDLDLAAQKLLQASEDAIMIGDSFLLAHTYNQLGNINIYREKYREAISYNQKALSMIAPYNLNSRAYIEGALGASYGELAILDSARYYIQKVVDFRRKGNNKYSLAVALINLADIDRQEDNCRAAITKNKEAYEISSKNNLNNLLLSAQVNLCECYYTLGELQLADRYAKEGIDIITTSPNMKNASDMYLCASKVSEKMGDLRKSLIYYKRHKMYADSVMNEKSEATVEEIQAKLAVAEKEANIQKLQEEAKINSLLNRQRILWMSLVIVLIAAIAFGYSVLSRKKVLAAQKRQAEIEQKLLRFQMNPHFIFNAISSIQNYLFDKSDLKLALTYLSKFADLMRQTLEHSREIHIPLERELASLENYLVLQQLRYQNKFDYEVQLSPDIDPSELLVPPLIAQPFVENAIEHGQIYQIPDGKVIISIKRVDGHLQMAIQDNGVGVSKMAIKEVSTLMNKKSLATIITKERLSALSSQSKKRFDLIIENLQQGGTLVTIDLPIIAAA